MLLTSVRDEFIFHCQCRKLSPKTIKNYTKQIDYCTLDFSSSGATKAPFYKPAYLKNADISSFSGLLFLPSVRQRKRLRQQDGGAGQAHDRCGRSVIESLKDPPEESGGSFFVLSSGFSKIRGILLHGHPRSSGQQKSSPSAAGFFYEKKSPPMASSQSTRHSVSPFGQNFVCSLAPPFPLETASLGFSRSPERMRGVSPSKTTLHSLRFLRLPPSNPLRRASAGALSGCAEIFFL